MTSYHLGGTFLIHIHVFLLLYKWRFVFNYIKKTTIDILTSIMWIHFSGITDLLVFGVLLINT